MDCGRLDEGYGALYESHLEETASNSTHQTDDLHALNSNRATVSESDHTNCLDVRRRAEGLNKHVQGVVL